MPNNQNSTPVPLNESHRFDASVSVWLNKNEDKFSRKDFPIYMFLGLVSDSKGLFEKFQYALEYSSKKGDAKWEYADYGEEEGVEVIGYFKDIKALDKVLKIAFEDKEFSIANIIDEGNPLNREGIVNRAKEALLALEESDGE